MLWVCEQDGVRYAVGLPACPQCGSTKRREEGSDPDVPAEVDHVPDGSATDVLAWVDDDPERAARALAVEQVKEKPRTTLVEQLTRVAAEGAR